jgi:hypothetical protein
MLGKLTVPETGGYRCGLRAEFCRKDTKQSSNSFGVRLADRKKTHVQRFTADSPLRGPSAPCSHSKPIQNDIEVVGSAETRLHL